MGFSIASFYGSNDIGKEAVARMQNSTTEYANKIANKSNSISSAYVMLIPQKNTGECRYFKWLFI